MTDTFLDRDRRRRNNYGFLRLFWASAVIIGHMFPVVQGTENDEFFMRATRGQMDFSGLAVNMFFAISGCLITLSWLRTPQFKTYLMKRVLRIYPGFVVASLVSLLIVAPLAGMRFDLALSARELVKSVARIVLLSPPRAAGAFATEPFDVLNMSLWTIRYEFICYLMVPLVVLLAARVGRVAVLVLFVVALASHAAQGRLILHGVTTNIPLIGAPDVWRRFGTYFLAGMVVAYYRDVIPYRWWLFALCIAAMVASALLGKFYLVVATAGVYALFYVAYQQVIPLHQVGNRWDLSYGVYLYGWPIQALLAMHLRGVMGVWALALVALALAMLVACLSWHFVEAPWLREKARLVRSEGAIAPPVQSPQALPPSDVPAAPAQYSPLARVGPWLRRDGAGESAPAAALPPG